MKSVRTKQRCTVLLWGLAVMLCGQPACSSEREVHGSITVYSDTAQALASADLISVHGTYGAGCTSRSGAWSVAVDSPAPPGPPGLSVLINDTSCVLTLTALLTAGGLVAAAPPIDLTTSYAAGPSKFSGSSVFYANARLSPASFSSDFELSLRYSSDPSLGAADHFAVAIPPTVIDETPESGATARSINTRPTAKFDTAMDAASLTSLTFTLHQGLTPVVGTVTFEAATNTATFKPSAVLGLNLPYRATITVGARDIGNTPLASDYVWNFTTAQSSQAPIALRTASTYAVLANATVSNTGATAIAGDLGASGSLVGFPPGTIDGALHIGDSAAAQAIADVTSAYVDAEGRMLDPLVVSGNIGGSTLLPGLYRAASSLEVSSGDLTLDASGDVDAVFIFQIGSTLGMSSGRRVLLTGGAQDANIYWQVGSSATLGTGSILRGTILADQSITLTSGATVYGRALARSVSVTMDTNTVVRPTL